MLELDDFNINDIFVLVMDGTLGTLTGGSVMVIMDIVRLVRCECVV